MLQRWNWVFSNEHEFWLSAPKTCSSGAGRKIVQIRMKAPNLAQRYVLGKDWILGWVTREIRPLMAAILDLLLLCDSHENYLQHEYTSLIWVNVAISPKIYYTYLLQTTEKITIFPSNLNATQYSWLGDWSPLDLAGHGTYVHPKQMF
jgi:hypothetical protein